jgi:Dephospho-CoA kinase
MIVGFTGPIGSGKSEAARLLRSLYGYAGVAFADAGKAMLAKLYKDLGMAAPEVFQMLYGNMKERPHPALCGHTSRHIMQTLMTDWGRQMVGYDLWVRAWQVRASEHLERGVPVVVDDVRFGNEVLAINEYGGTVIALTNRRGESAGANHVSDSHWRELGDVVISNSGTVDDLRTELVKALGHVGGEA